MYISFHPFQYKNVENDINKDLEVLATFSDHHKLQLHACKSCKSLANLYSKQRDCYDLKEIITFSIHDEEIQMSYIAKNLGQNCPDFVSKPRKMFILKHGSKENYM